MKVCIYIVTVDFTEGRIVLRGKIETNGVADGLRVYAVVDGKRRKIELVDGIHQAPYWGFELEVGEFARLSFEAEVDGTAVVPNLAFDVWSRVDAELGSSCRHGRRIYFVENAEIKSVPSTLGQRKHFWAWRWSEIAEQKQWELARLRICRTFSRLWQRKPIWLMSDREGCAEDNGEAFFSVY